MPYIFVSLPQGHTLGISDVNGILIKTYNYGEIDETDGQTDGETYRNICRLTSEVNSLAEALVTSKNQCPSNK